MCRFRAVFFAQPAPFDRHDLDLTLPLQSPVRRSVRAPDREGSNRNGGIAAIR
jgi:hypothetical protein